MPSEQEHFVFISCGTWALFGTELKRPIVSKEVMELGLSNEGGYGDTAIMLKNIMGLSYFKPVISDMLSRVSANSQARL